MIFSRGEPLKKVPTERLVDELFAEISKSYPAGGTVVRDEAQAAEAAAWLEANEDASALERLAALEEAAARTEDEDFAPTPRHAPPSTRRSPRSRAGASAAPRTRAPVAAEAQPPAAAVGRGPARDLWPLLAGPALCLALGRLRRRAGGPRNFSSTVVIAPFLTALWGTTRQTAAIGALATPAPGEPGLERQPRLGGVPGPGLRVVLGAGFAVIGGSARNRLITGRARFALLAGRR